MAKPNHSHLTDPRRICQLIAEFCQALYPGFRGAKLRVILPDGEVATFPVSTTLLVYADPPTLETPTGAMESAIVEALEELDDGKKLTGEELAEAAGYPYHGRFKAAVAKLQKAGLIENRKPGYCLKTQAE